MTRSFDEAWERDVSREPSHTGRPRRPIPLNERGAVRQQFEQHPKTGGAR
ncbi:MAG: hypothetical protein M3619_00750 [Myxococcota bacterium]|nr:hypothetical protein [Myxococcota bacterium]